MILKTTITSNLDSETPVEFTAHKLAEMYKNERDNFLALNLVNIFSGWGGNEIEDFFCEVDDIEQINIIVKWTILTWESMYDPDSFTNLYNSGLQQARTNFSIRLHSILNCSTKRIELKKRKAEIEGKMLADYAIERAVTHPNPTLGTDVNTRTQPPRYNAQSQTTPVEYQMSNFDKNKINILLIYDDETFSLFVTTLRKEICPYVLSNKKKYANALKFLCIVHHIVARKTSMNDFDVLLQELVPGIGSMLSSMKLRKDANEEKNYRLYADPKRRKDDSCYLLTRDCSEMEEMLQPVIERLEEK